MHRLSYSLEESSGPQWLKKNWTFTSCYMNMQNLNARQVSPSLPKMSSRLFLIRPPLANMLPTLHCIGQYGTDFSLSNT